MRRVDDSGGDVVYYVHADHLGSTSLVTCGSADCDGKTTRIAWWSQYPTQQKRATKYVFLPYAVTTIRANIVRYSEPTCAFITLSSKNEGARMT